MTLTIAEEVLLLAYRDETGKPQIGAVELDAALAGAILAGRARVKEIAEGQWAGAAVRKTIASIHAAVAAGVVAATAGGAASASG